MVVKTESEMFAPRRAVTQQTPTRGRGQGSKGKKGAVKRPARVGRGMGRRRLSESGVHHNWSKEERLEELKTRFEFV